MSLAMGRLRKSEWAAIGETDLKDFKDFRVVKVFKVCGKRITTNNARLSIKNQGSRAVWHKICTEKVAKTGLCAMV